MATGVALYEEYVHLCEQVGVKAKALKSFSSKAKLAEAVEKLRPTPAAASVASASLTPAQRAKLRRLVKQGKVTHRWGDKWQLDDATRALLKAR